MAQTKVVVLSGHSLFADGTASRLEQYSGDLETVILDPAQPDIVKQLLEFKPAVAFIDPKDPHLCETASLAVIFQALPDLRVVMLDSQSADIQILSSRSFAADAVRDLVEALATERLNQNS